MSHGVIFQTSRAYYHKRSVLDSPRMELINSGLRYLHKEPLSPLQYLVLGLCVSRISELK